MNAKPPFSTIFPLIGLVYKSSAYIIMLPHSLASLPRPNTGLSRTYRLPTMHTAWLASRAPTNITRCIALIVPLRVGTLRTAWGSRHHSQVASLVSPYEAKDLGSHIKIRAQVWGCQDAIVGKVSAFLKQTPETISRLFTTIHNMLMESSRR